MSIETTASRSPYAFGDESGYDCENVVLSSVDYIPKSGKTGTPAVQCRGFVILNTTGVIKLDTPGGNTVSIPSGLAVGVFHRIAFTKIYSGTTTAVGLLAIT